MLRGVVLCIVHQRTSYPGRLGRLFMERDFALDVRCPNVGQALPATTADYAATLMFGGPQSAFDDHLPAIRQELAWTETAIAGAAPFIGVCLGGQILARVLGAEVWRHPAEHVEIGYSEIRPTQEGRSYLDRPMRVFQWHKDGFDLPPDAVLLAAGGQSFPNQLFRYGAHCYGMQFHPEVTHDMMRRWSGNAAKWSGTPGAMSQDEMLGLHPVCDPPFGQWAATFVDHVIRLAEARGACAAEGAAA